MHDLFGWAVNPEPLSWDILLKIAIGAARGLAFLHNLENKVTYSGLKASCILLDKVCFSLSHIDLLFYF
jgi:hypothetical protein